jgi:hypothetical protein
VSQHRADLIPIELYGANTGNCLRVSIALEEAGIPYVVKLMDLRRGDAVQRHVRAGSDHAHKQSRGRSE